MKSGAKTTEFYLTIFKAAAGPIIAILVAMDIGTETELEKITAALLTLGALLISGNAVTTYTESRSGIKITEIQAGVVEGSEHQESLIGFNMEEEEYDDTEEDE